MTSAAPPAATRPKPTANQPRKRRRRRTLARLTAAIEAAYIAEVARA